MRLLIVDSELFVSATDLSNFLSCRHRTALELAEADGARKRRRFDDPFLEILAQRGREHEKGYVESLRTGVRRVVDLSDPVRRDPGGESAVVRAGMSHPATMKLANALCRYRELARPLRLSVSDLSWPSSS